MFLYLEGADRRRRFLRHEGASHSRARTHPG